MSALMIALLLFAFILGSIPFGVIVARLFQVKDLQSRGSGNIGATNVSRVLGFWPAGFIVFLLDGLKGVFAAALASEMLAPAVESVGTVLRDQGGDWSLASLSPQAAWWFGAASVLGHCFTPWLRFKGGKGVATGFGALLVLSPWAALGGILTFALTFGLSRIGSLSSLAGILLASWIHLVLYPAGLELWPGAILVSIILLRHETNIAALLEARENRF